MKVAVKQESLFFIKWDLTTFNLLMNQFHSSKNISYSGYCRVRSDGGSLIALIVKFQTFLTSWRN